MRWGSSTAFFRFMNHLEFIDLKKSFKFSFNQALRDFFKDPPKDSTLQDALICYQTSLKIKKEHPDQPIGKQFEYNQHMRDFFIVRPRSIPLRAFNGAHNCKI